MSPEKRARLALVRAAKARKARSGGSPDLTPAELDRLLPPVPCARTRHTTTEDRPMPKPKAPKPEPPALTRVRLDVSPDERRHLQLAAAEADLRGMSQYVRRLVQEDMRRKARP